MVDTECPKCGNIVIDVLLREKDETGAYIMPICGQQGDGVSCGETVRRAYVGHAAYVVGDDIPGGVWIRHGICNDDGTPRRYDSKSEMARAAKEKGLINRVEHVPSPGSDKNRGRHTQRFI